MNVENMTNDQRKLRIGFLFYGPMATDCEQMGRVASAREYARRAMLCYRALVTGDKYLTQRALHSI